MYTATMRTIFVILILILSLCGSASANWFNNSEKYLTACQNEAVHRYYVKERDDLISSTRYAIMIRRFAKQSPSVERWKPKPRYPGWAA